MQNTKQEAYDFLTFLLQAFYRPFQEKILNVHREFSCMTLLLSPLPCRGGSLRYKQHQRLGFSTLLPWHAQGPWVNHFSVHQ